MDPRRVVITGIGAVSPLGNNCQEYSRALFAGISGIKKMSSVDVSQLRFKNAAEVSNFNPEDHFDERQILWIDRYAQMAVVAAREAVKDSGIKWTEELQDKTCVITGTSMGGQITQDENYYDLYHKDCFLLPPSVIPRVMSNAAASHISIEFGTTGPTYTVSTACASSTHAIGQAFYSIRQGMSEMAITGGSEAPFAFGNLKAWETMRVVSTDTCRPFSKNRSGMILGEGSAMFCLETLERAQKRGAPIYAEICGFGMSSDAFHLTQPAVAGPTKAMKLALHDAGLEPEQIGYINAHGTATKANDRMEARAIRNVFAKHTDKIAVSSTKSMHGHALGAAGALEALATVLALHHGNLPPTANFTEPDPECDLDIIQNKMRPTRVEAALSNSFAFGGLNAALVIKNWNG